MRAAISAYVAGDKIEVAHSSNSGMTYLNIKVIFKYVITKSCATVSWRPYVGSIYL